MMMSVMLTARVRTHSSLTPMLSRTPRRNLLDSARRLQCHTFHSWKLMKPAKYKLYKCTHQQPVSRHNRLLLNRRHVSWSGPNPQSRASSSRPNITKADKSILDNHNSALAHFTFLKII